jgi:TonB family protein
MNKFRIILEKGKIGSIISYFGIGLVFLYSCDQHQDSNKKPTANKKPVLNKIEKVRSIDTLMVNKDIPIPPVKPERIIPILPEPEPPILPGGCPGPPEPPEPLPIEYINADTVLTIVEVMPEFPGGSKAFSQYVRDNVIYPEIAKEIGVEGKVFVKFIVHSSGQISSTQIARGVFPSLDQEAMRLIKLMPRWNPGVQNGKTVPVYCILPVVFRLD